MQPHDTASDEDVFAHHSDVECAGLDVLRVGQLIRYDAVPNRKRPGIVARNIEVIE